VSSDEWRERGKGRNSGIAIGKSERNFVFTEAAGMRSRLEIRRWRYGRSIVTNVQGGSIATGTAGRPFTAEAQGKLMRDGHVEG
jgi:hypothetical protein